MITLARLKQEMLFTYDLGDIIDVLKTAALIQFRSFQLRENPLNEFNNELEAGLHLLFETSAVIHPYLFERSGLPNTILIITSDEGFLGELNTMLMNTGLDQCKSKDDEIVVMGERGRRYLEDLNKDFMFFPGISDEVRHKEAEGIRDYLLEAYRLRCARIIVVYPEFISLTSRKIQALQLLPYKRPSSTEEAKKYAHFKDEVLIEPSLQQVIEGLVRLWLGFKLLKIFWSSKQSEYAARIMHLEASTQELSELNHRLSFQYFRQVHALSDKTIREISASKILLEKGSK